ncbi:hypothetical protein ACOSQ4_031627 [Xanthoceras sorbifolium]
MNLLCRRLTFYRSSKPFTDETEAGVSSSIFIAFHRICIWLGFVCFLLDMGMDDFENIGEALYESSSASITSNLSVHIYNISSDEDDTGAAKHPPPRFESSEDDFEYFPYSNNFFSKANLNASLPSDGDMSNEGKMKNNNLLILVMKKIKNNNNLLIFIMKKMLPNNNLLIFIMKKMLPNNNLRILIIKTMIREMNNFRM